MLYPYASQIFGELHASFCFEESGKIVGIVAELRRDVRDRKRLIGIYSHPLARSVYKLSSLLLGYVSSPRPVFENEESGSGVKNLAFV